MPFAKIPGKGNEKIKTDYIVKVGGKSVYVSVSPASWMYDTYGLQIGVSLKKGAENAETEFFIDKKLHWKRVTNNAVAAFIKKTVKPALLVKLEKVMSESAKRRKEFEKKWAVEEKKREKLALKAKEKAKSKGFTHYTTVVIHSEFGDDSMTEVFLKKKVTPKALADFLKKKYKVHHVDVGPIKAL